MCTQSNMIHNQLLTNLKNQLSEIKELKEPYNNNEGVTIVLPCVLYNTPYIINMVKKIIKDKIKRIIFLVDSFNEFYIFKTENDTEIFSPSTEHGGRFLFTKISFDKNIEIITMKIPDDTTISVGKNNNVLMTDVSSPIVEIVSIIKDIEYFKPDFVILHNECNLVSDIILKGMSLKSKFISLNNNSDKCMSMIFVDN